jgi:nitrile hydratase subunit beta
LNGIHDVGGMHGFGPVVIDPDEPVFAADWERTVFGVTIVALGAGLFNLDEFRYATEREDPARSLASPYYEHWLSAVELLTREKAIVAAGELDAARRRWASSRPRRPSPGDDRRGSSELALAMRGVIRHGASVRREATTPPAFRVGDAVRAKNMHPSSHTRLPRYARGRHGTVTAGHGAFVFPDANASGLGERPQHLYSVRFEARELWGEHGRRGDSVSLDLWESYLEAGGPGGARRPAPSTEGARA